MKEKLEELFKKELEAEGYFVRLFEFVQFSTSGPNDDFIDSNWTFRIRAQKRRKVN